ncbi:UDP-N-acetylmuramoyl-tripeptide--D-alanyl-D-alanine ligase [Viridibacillus sp. YIM B01967]|uniref:UDP-N-acetylmuramoyl-tripeptide--D-alanyl-D-alanine ligase n=1 Tax=Viridibacillus soli TaxID=2798301 RepID=A0ABS1H5S9_9BACL|nr:UDP-N-acetylmuramoyl-tripeptide--D-alanyl-D-alanine ligase [Viridibacillus soli]MBK3494517.1 UDP-N-acetylmuramoyl-tripeptide--D-alanyl-D-alanine ligase [Viridibacillus soli]
MKKTLKQIVNWLNSDQQIVDDVVVTGISINTRTLQVGDLFIPFRGEKTNGHRYVEQAFENGAAASFWLKDEPNPPAGLPLLFVDNPEEALQQMATAYRQEHCAKFIGITGSNGKTSTKDLVAGVLSPYYKVQKTEGNFNNELGLPLTILSLDEDTDFAVLEMGMSGFGEIEFLTKLAKPHFTAITNIGEAHLQDLGSREGIAKAKFEIVQGLQPGGKLFYDGDEPLLSPLVAGEKHLQALSFGLEGSNDLLATNITTTENGSAFTVEGLLDTDFFISVLGSHQVKNTLVAILIAREVGLSTEQIREALKDISLTNMRMQLVNGAQGILFVNDAYNAAPTSVKAALQFIKATDIRTDKWVVLGDMLELGELEQQFHEEIALAIDVENIHQVCLYGPRMKWLYEKLQSVLPAGRLLWTAEDYAPIIKHLRENAGTDSIVLLKGSRGMALENVLKAFND